MQNDSANHSKKKKSLSINANIYAATQLIFPTKKGALYLGLNLFGKRVLCLIGRWTNEYLQWNAKGESNGDNSVKTNTSETEKNLVLKST